MLKKVLLNFAKFACTLGLLWWLIHTGKLDWALLAELKSHPWRLIAALALCVMNLALCTWRWRLLLTTRSSEPLPFGRLMLVNWIGMFFSATLPGSVTGDVIKVFYARQKNHTLSTAFLLFSCLTDRLIGLAGLILLIGLSSWINYQDLLALSPKLGPILNFNFLLLAGLAIVLALFFCAPQLIKRALLQLAQTMPRLPRLNSVIELWQNLASSRRQIAQCLLLSLLVQFIGALIFHGLVSPQYTVSLSLGLVLSFIPLGFIAVAIPIAPGGLGVGHAAFQSLFALAGEENGANFFNLYFVVLMFFNLLGFIPWLILRRK